MAATAVVWQPQDGGLSEICALLEQQISPSSVVDKSQIWKQLQHFSQFPDFNNYLVFILVRAQVLVLSLLSLRSSDFLQFFPPYWLNLLVQDDIGLCNSDRWFHSPIRFSLLLGLVDLAFPLDCFGSSLENHTTLVYMFCALGVFGFLLIIKCLCRE